MGAPWSWTIFDGFVALKRELSWASLSPFIETGQAFARQHCSELPDLVRTWNEHLEALGGDPSTYDWTTFRPLALDHETDWSDWLHHFFAKSTTGQFAFELFGRSRFESAKQCALPSVKCEDVSEDRRADLVIAWVHGDYTQLEVKVGDLGLEKTYDTAHKLEQKYGACWTHYLLVPWEDEHWWHSLEHQDRITVHLITWDDVAVALRRCLRLGAEDRRWLAWACGFCGLVEQKLIGLPLSTAPLDICNISRHVRQIAIMKKGLEDA